MIELDPGHKYSLFHLDGDGTETLTFVKRNNPPEKFPGNDAAYEGTTSQEVMRALIRRAIYVDNQFHHQANIDQILRLRLSIYDLERRAAERHNRDFSLTSHEFKTIDELPTCPKCGHIKPETHEECQ